MSIIREFYNVQIESELFFFNFIGLKPILVVLE